MHGSDHLLVNSFYCIPTWENVHFDGNEELPICVNEPRKRAELLTVAMASVASSHLTINQQQDLQALLDECADVFSRGRAGTQNSRPKTVRDVKSVQGMLAYYLHFVPQSARIAAPLHASDP